MKWYLTFYDIYIFQTADAVEAIVTFTTGALELLKRKKMKREYLFRYLAQNYISISPTAEKHQLAQTIVELWSGGNSQVSHPSINIVCPEIF